MVKPGQIEQATILMQDSGTKPTTAMVELGYRGVGAENPGPAITHRGDQAPQGRPPDRPMSFCKARSVTGLHALLCCADQFD
jgi:hypothetical protein